MIRPNLKFFAPSSEALSRSDILFDAETLRWHFNDRWHGPSGVNPWGKTPYAEIARDLGIDQELLRQTMLGLREPAATFLNAAGYERVLYRRRPKE